MRDTYKNILVKMGILIKMQLMKEFELYFVFSLVPFTVFLLFKICQIQSSLFLMVLKYKQLSLTKYPQSLLFCVLSGAEGTYASELHSIVTSMERVAYSYIPSRYLPAQSQQQKHQNKAKLLSRVFKQVTKKVVKLKQVETP